MTNTTGRFDPSTHKSVVSVGLDGNSRPMWRYLADLHLPDSQRRIVAPEHRPAQFPDAEPKNDEGCTPGGWAKSPT